MESTKLNELLTFPCNFTFKVMGAANINLSDKVVMEVQKVIPGDYTTSSKPSAKGNYESVSITIRATAIEQIETLYQTLAKIESVRMVL